jgi:hypothetical protein
MNSHTIKTEHDFIIKDLFKNIFQELKKIKLPNGFPYIEHDSSVIKYYPNQNDALLEDLKAKHYKLDTEIDEGLHQEKVFINSFIEYLIMQNTFNHNYPYKSPFEIKDFFEINDYRFDIYSNLYDKVFKELPLNRIDLRKKYSLSSIDIYKYPESDNIREEYILFKGASDKHRISYKMITNPNKPIVLKEHTNIKDPNLLKLYKEIYNSCIVQYPYTYEIIESYDTEVIVFSDVIRIMYRYATEYFPDNNEVDQLKVYNRDEFIKSLEEHDTWWEFINDIVLNKYDMGFYEHFEITLEILEDCTATNSFQLLLVSILIELYKSLNSNFAEVIKNARKKFEDTSSLSDVQFIQYLIDFYQNEILNSKHYKLAICKGVKLNKVISDLFVKILINLLERKKLEYDKRLHENYIFNPDKSNIEFDDFIGLTKIPKRNKNHDTFLDKEETYLLMLLLKKENIFLEGVSDTLLQKITETLTGYKSNQLRKLGSDNSKIIKPTQKEKYDKVERVLKSILKRINALKQL